VEGVRGGLAQLLVNPEPTGEHPWRLRWRGAGDANPADPLEGAILSSTAGWLLSQPPRLKLPSVICDLDLPRFYLLHIEVFYETSNGDRARVVGARVADINGLDTRGRATRWAWRGGWWHPRLTIEVVSALRGREEEGGGDLGEAMRFLVSLARGGRVGGGPSRLAAFGPYEVWLYPDAGAVLHDFSGRRMRFAARCDPLHPGWVEVALREECVRALERALGVGLPVTPLSLRREYGPHAEWAPAGGAGGPRLYRNAETPPTAVVSLDGRALCVLGSAVEPPPPSLAERLAALAEELLSAWRGEEP
jgi:hypothetical protein